MKNLLVRGVVSIVAGFCCGLTVIWLTGDRNIGIATSMIISFMTSQSFSYRG